MASSIVVSHVRFVGSPSNDASGDQSIQRKSVGAPQIQQHREVACRDHRTVLAADHGLALHVEIVGGQRDHLGHRRSADNARRTARAGGGEGGLDGRGPADRLEDDVGAAAPGPGLDRRDGVLRVRVDDVGGAEFQGGVPAGGHRIHGDDLGGTTYPRAHHGGQTDPPESDHRHGAAVRHGCGVQCGAGAGGHPAAHQGRDVQRNVIVDLDHRAAQTVGRGGETGHAHRGEQCGALCVGRIRHRVDVTNCVAAQMYLTALAVPAPAAGGDPGDRHMIARRHVAYLGTHLLDDAGTLVPQYAGRARR